MSGAPIGPAPGKPRNPALLVADTDAVIQLVVGDCISILKSLKDTYGIQVTVMPAVKSELLLKAERKFARYKKPILKTFDSEVIELLDANLLASKGWASPDRVVGQIDELGGRYINFVDRGEAYSYAAANLLRLPLLSNDGAAIGDLLDSRITLPNNLLRAFDVIVFGNQIQILSGDDCDGIRKKLVQEEEHVPKCFANTNYKTGLGGFFARLADRQYAPIGSDVGVVKLDTRLWIDVKPASATP